MAEPTTAMAHEPRVRRSVGSSSIPTKYKTGLSPFRRANCSLRERVHGLKKRSRHAPDCSGRRLVRPAFTVGGANSRSCRASGAAQYSELVLCLRQRGADHLPAANRHRHSTGAHLCSLGWGSMEQPAGAQPRCDPRLVYPRAARMGFELHDRDRAHPYGSGLPFRGLQVSSRAHVDRWRLSLADDTGHGLQRPGAAFRSRCILGTWHRSVHRKTRTDHRARSREGDVGWTDHCRRDAISVLRPACLRDSRNVDRICGPSSSDGAEAGYQRMADARPPRKQGDLRERIPRVDEAGWCSVRSLRALERFVLRGIHPSGRRGMRCVLRSLRSNGPPGSDDYPDSTETGLLFPVALCFAVAAASFDGNASTSRWSGSFHPGLAPSAFHFRRRRKELASAAHRGFDGNADRGNARDTHAPRWIYPLEPAHERLEWRSGAGEISAPHKRIATARRPCVSGQTMPKLPFAWGVGRTKRSGTRHRRRATHTRSTYTPSDSRRWQHAGLRQEFEPR